MKVKFNLDQIQPSIYLVTADHRYDLGQLFVCVQEYYESAHDLWKSTHFDRPTYERWYALNVSEDGIFSYPNDWCGFNVPSSAIRSFYYDAPHDITTNYYDRMMVEIDKTISRNMKYAGDYYLIGTLVDDVQTLDHEIAHGLYATSPVYKHDMDLLIAKLTPRTQQRVRKVLSRMGYADVVHDDEIQANFATGLTNHFEGFQRFCSPFVNCFNRHRITRQFEPVFLSCDV